MKNKFDGARKNFDSIWPTIFTISGLAIFGPLVLLTLTDFLSFVPSMLFPIIGGILSFWSFIVASFLFGHWAVYLLLCGGILCSAALVLQQKHTSPWRALFALTSAAFVLAFMLLPYKPVVHLANDDDQMFVLTKPSVLFRGLSRAQSLTEIQPCDYRILGWQNASLFYEATCSGTVKTWQFRADGSSAPYVVDEIDPDVLFGQQSESATFIDLFQTRGVHPSESERAVIGLALRNGALLSPDQEWVAIVTQHTVYGPKDIIVLKVSENDIRPS